MLGKLLTEHIVSETKEDNMFTFDQNEEIRFTKAIYYNFHPIPLPKPFKDGTGGMGQFAPEQGCIELYDDQGMCAHLSVNRDFVKNVLPFILTGEKKSYKEWKNQLYWQTRNSGFQSARAVEVGVLDLLMIDILSQRAEMPLHRFMGATKDWAAAYKGGGSLLLEDTELVEDMVRYVEEGYRTVKFKVGSENVERDLRRIEKVRAALGDDIEIAVDANQKWDVKEAYQFFKLTEPFNLGWIEEPIHANDMNGIKLLKEKDIVTPIAFGESMRISYEYEIYVEKGVTHLQPSVGRMTRMEDLILIRDLARKNKIRFSSGGRIYLNAIFGCLYNENEPIEYHEPISKPVGEYTLHQPLEKDGKFYCPGDIAGNPQRMNVEKLEKDGLLESKVFFYAN